MTTNQTIGLVVAVIVIVAGALYLLKPHGTAMAPTYDNAMGTSTDTTTSTSTTTTSTSAEPATINYTNSGFSPKSVTVSAGSKVTWTNNSTKPMWVASASHPSHTGYDSTSKDQHCAAGYTGAAPFDSCVGIAPGASYSFTFTKVGSWGYHNHVSANDFGTVVVTAATSVTSTTTVEVKVN